MTARDLTGAFPNWEMVLPKNFTAFAEINAKELREALVRVGVMADDKNRRVEFEFHSDKVILKTESFETGNSTEEVGCNFQKLEDAASQAEGGWKISFNTKYLTDFFSIHGACTDGLIVWKFSCEGAQTELAFEGEERLFSYILVPLKN
jgi:DNA polymerase-3 subunit beta